MKKTLSLLLALVMCLSLAACGGGSETPKQDTTKPPTTTEAPTETESTSSRETTPDGNEFYYVDEDISTDYFNFIVKEATFTNFVVLEKTSDFLTPTTEVSLDTYGAEENYRWLYYEVEYSYCGKSTLSHVESLFRPTVYYGEYEFNSEYFTFGKINDTWYIFTDDFNGVANRLQNGLSSNGWLKYEPLDDTVYLLRGIIKVPVKAIEDKEVPIYLKLLNVDSASATKTVMTGYYFEINR